MTDDVKPGSFEQVRAVRCAVVLDERTPSVGYAVGTLAFYGPTLSLPILLVYPTEPPPPGMVERAADAAGLWPDPDLIVTTETVACDLGYDPGDDDGRTDPGATGLICRYTARTPVATVARVPAEWVLAVRDERASAPAEHVHPLREGWFHLIWTMDARPDTPRWEPHIYLAEQRAAGRVRHGAVALMSQAGAIAYMESD